MTPTRPAPALRHPPPPAGVWSPDRCPPLPLVRVRDLCLPPGEVAGGRVPDGAHPVLADVLAVAPRVTAAHRAAALALLVPGRHGVVVRASAVWVWTGEETCRPGAVDLALPPSPPRLPGPRPVAGSPVLAVRRTRWSPGAAWSLLSGLAVTTPLATAVDCARRLPVGSARTCVEALVRTTHVDLAAVAALVRPARAGQTPQGSADAAALLASLPGRSR